MYDDDYKKFTNAKRVRSDKKLNFKSTFFY